MNFLDRWDEKWLEQVFDSQKRTQRIKKLGENRRTLYWCVSVFLILMFVPGPDAIPSGFWVGILGMMFCCALQEQNLRLLKLVDRLLVDNVPRTEPPAADAI